MAFLPIPGVNLSDKRDSILWVSNLKESAFELLFNNPFHGLFDLHGIEYLHLSEYGDYFNRCIAYFIAVSCPHYPYSLCKNSNFLNKLFNLQTNTELNYISTAAVILCHLCLVMIPILIIFSSYTYSSITLIFPINQVNWETWWIL